MRNHGGSNKNFGESTQAEEGKPKEVPRRSKFTRISHQKPETKKPKNQTQNTETIILPESPPKSPVTKKPHKFYVIFNGSMKGIYDEWHKVAQFITGKNVIHQSYSTIDEAKRALEESSKKKKTN